jgi:hypothetical protein
MEGKKGGRILALTSILLAAASGCGGGGGSTPAAGTNTGTLTFTRVYSDVLGVSCMPCHAPGGVGAAAGRLDMSSQGVAYTNLQKGAAGSSCSTSGLKLVVPGDPSMSLLVQKVESAHPPCGVQMPFGCGGATACLPASQVQELEDWVNAGAKND